MRKYLVLLMSLLFMECAGTKTAGLYDTYNSDDYVIWSEDRKLAWSDFRGAPEYGNDVISESLFKLPSRAGRENVFTQKEITAFAVFDKSKSWVKKELASDRALLFNQVMFDIYELYARRLKKEFHEAKINIEDTEKEFRRINEENNRLLKNELTKYQVITKLGDDETAIKEWSVKIKDRLNELKEYQQKHL